MYKVKPIEADYQKLQNKLDLFKKQHLEDINSVGRIGSENVILENKLNIAIEGYADLLMDSEIIYSELLKIGRVKRSTEDYFVDENRLLSQLKDKEKKSDYITALKIFRDGYWPNKPKCGQGFEWWCEQKIKETVEKPDNQEEEIIHNRVNYGEKKISKIKKDLDNFKSLTEGKNLSDEELLIAIKFYKAGRDSMNEKYKQKCEMFNTQSKRILARDEEIKELKTKLKAEIKESWRVRKASDETFQMLSEAKQQIEEYKSEYERVNSEKDDLLLILSEKDKQIESMKYCINCKEHMIASNNCYHNTKDGECCDNWTLRITIER